MIYRFLEVCSDNELIAAIKLAGEFLESRILHYNSLVLADKAIKVLEQSLDNIRKHRRAIARITDKSINLAM